MWLITAHDIYLFSLLEITLKNFEAIWRLLLPIQLALHVLTENNLHKHLLKDNPFAYFSKDCRLKYIFFYSNVKFSVCFEKQTNKQTNNPHQFPYSVENQIDQFFADGVVTTCIVVGGIFLAGNQLFRVKELTVGPCADLICLNMLKETGYIMLILHTMVLAF